MNKHNASQICCNLNCATSKWICKLRACFLHEPFLAKKKNFKLKVHEFAHVSTILFISCCIIEHKIARGYLGSISLRTVCANTPVFSRRTSIVANLRWRRWKHALMWRPVFWIPCATNTQTIQTASFSSLCLRQITKW